MPEITGTLIRVRRARGAVAANQTLGGGTYRQVEMPHVRSAGQTRQLEVQDIAGPLLWRAQCGRVGLRANLMRLGAPTGGTQPSSSRSLRERNE